MDEVMGILDPEGRSEGQPYRVRAQRAMSHLDGERLIAERRAEKAAIEMEEAQQLAREKEALSREHEAARRKAVREREVAVEQMAHAEADAAHFEGLAERTTKAFVDAFSSDAVEKLRGVINGLRENTARLLVEATEPVLAQLSLLESVIEVRRVSEEPLSFCARIPMTPEVPGGYADTPDGAVAFLTAALQGKLAERNAILHSENHFRSALRHVQTEMRTVVLAFKAIQDGVDTALDDERGAPRGFYENFQIDTQPSPCVARLVPPKDAPQAAYLIDGTKLRVVMTGRRAWLEHLGEDNKPLEDGEEQS
jgi:hypothetical protein